MVKKRKLKEKNHSERQTKRKKAEKKERRQ